MIKILIIEDDPDSNTLFSYLLSHYGYEVFSATSAEEGLTLIEKVTPDIFLVDILLPGINGLEFMKKVRKMEKFKKTCCIAISALSGIDFKFKLLEAGFSDYISKPIQAGKFTDQIQEIYSRFTILEEE